MEQLNVFECIIFPLFKIHCTYCKLCIGLTFSFSFVALPLDLWEKKKTSPPTEPETVPAPDDKKAKCDNEASPAVRVVYLHY